MDPNEQMRHALQSLGPGIFAFMGFFILVKYSLYIIPLWRAATKAGLAGPIALLAVIPFIGRLIALYVIAFAEWKVAPVAPYGTLPPSYPPAYPPASYPPQAPPL